MYSYEHLVVMKKLFRALKHGVGIQYVWYIYLHDLNHITYHQSWLKKIKKPSQQSCGETNDYMHLFEHMKKVFFALAQQK